jgi:hypothetical protein
MGLRTRKRKLNSTIIKLRELFGRPYGTVLNFKYATTNRGEIPTNFRNLFWNNFIKYAEL